VEVAAVTRSELTVQLGVSRDVLLHWEKAGLVGPSGRAGDGRTHPNLYLPEDLPQVQVVAALHRLGVPVRRCQEILSACRGLDLPAGWSGWLVLRAPGAAVAAAGDLEAVLRGHQRAAAVIWVTFPSGVPVRFPYLPDRPGP